MYYYHSLSPRVAPLSSTVSSRVSRLFRCRSRSREEERRREKDPLRDDAQREQDAVYDVVPHG